MEIYKLQKMVNIYSLSEVPLKWGKKQTKKLVGLV